MKSIKYLMMTNRMVEIDHLRRHTNFNSWSNVIMYSWNAMTVQRAQDIGSSRFEIHRRTDGGKANVVGIDTRTKW